MRRCVIELFIPPPSHQAYGIRLPGRAGKGRPFKYAMRAFARYRRFSEETAGEEVPVLAEESMALQFQCFQLFCCNCGRRQHIPCTQDAPDEINVHNRRIG